MDSPAEEPPRKGRSNAILTYETVEQLALGIQRVDIKLDHLREDLTSVDRRHGDHEVRIRALELTIAGSTASRSTASWLWQAAWPAAAFGIALLTYLSRS